MNTLPQSYDEPRGDIQVYRRPDEVLAEATEAAKALHTVLAAKTKKVMMNGEQYLEFEDWQTVGRFYGITVKVISTEFIDYGAAQGFLAKAVAIRADGMEVSAAEAMCLNDEEKWSARTKYEYLYVLKDGTKQVEDPPSNMITWVDNPNKPGKKMPLKEKVATGEVKVPLFQLRSMAQTRACAKALRNVLAWVVVLAGYRPTPAEELDGQTHDEPQAQAPQETKAPLQEPQKKSTKKEAAGEQTVSVLIKNVEAKAGEKNGKKYTIYSIFDVAGEKYGTFDEALADLARTAIHTEQIATITFTDGQYGKKITGLTLEELTEREPGIDG